VGDKPNIECTWEAWYNRMPGTDDPDLYVLGRCKLPSGSIQITLELGNVGTPPPPDLVALDCTVDVPEVGTSDYTERDVPWQDDVGPDVKRVRIQKDLNAEIEVEIRH